MVTPEDCPALSLAPVEEGVRRAGLHGNRPEELSNFSQLGGPLLDDPGDVIELDVSVYERSGQRARRRGLSLW